MEVKTSLPIESYFDALAVAVNFARSREDFKAQGLNSKAIDRAIVNHRFLINRLFPPMTVKPLWAVRIDGFFICIDASTGKCATEYDGLETESKN